MINRRKILKNTLLLSLSSPYAISQAISEISFKNKNIILKKIPISQEEIPVIGMGSWLTFDVGYDKKELKERKNILQVFFEKGGAIIDSSPMYGRSERVIGKCLRLLNNEKLNLFSASKIWTPNNWHGKKQFENSQDFWGIKKFSLMQVHNLVNYEGHLDYLHELKKRGMVRYIGITTSHGWRHEKLKFIMENYKVDFVQLTYNIIDTEAEKFLLPLAKERKIAVIANRPFQGGKLFNYVKNKKVPAQFKEYGVSNWSELFLKYVVSNSSITCTIPATSKVQHMHENMNSLYGYLPSDKERIRLKKFFLDA